MTEATDEYLRHRDLVLRLAYDITASWADAEDIAQQVFLRWNRWNPVGEVRNPRAYLARIATNQALDVVAARDRVGYPRPYLPEPIATGPGAEEAVAIADEVEIALMVVLGSLSPLERAVFVLHDVFAFTHAEIGTMLERSSDAVRQLASRARRHVHSRGAAPEPVDHGELAEFTARFLAAARDGDVPGLREYLTEDVVFVGDGGGKRAAGRRPIVGADKVARFFAGIAREVGEHTRIVAVEANHRPALAIYQGDELDQVLWLVLQEGRLAQALAVRNPDKLTRIAGQFTSSP